MAKIVDFTWPAMFEEQPDGRMLVTFPDLPEALTEGDGERDAFIQAEDCLAEAIAGRIDDREDIPAPSRRRRGQRMIDLPPLLAAKAALYIAMHEVGIRNTQLAAQLGCNEKEVRRMLNPRHETKIPRIANALRLLGRRLQTRMAA